MGQKVHPKGIRLGIIRDWDSKWYADKRQYQEYLLADIRVRDVLFEKLKDASVARIAIERPENAAKVIIYTARPGVVIGKKGAGIDQLKDEVSKILKVGSYIVIEEVKKPELNATLVAESIGQQLEKRVMYRRAVKRAIANAMRQGALGIKIQIGGRLNGVEIARNEWYREGRVPLQTFRADIDYGVFSAGTQYGVIGIKVWVFNGEILDHKKGVLSEINNRHLNIQAKKYLAKD